MSEQILYDEPTVENLSEDEAIPFEYSITSYGADYDVDGLVRRLKTEDILVPEFQRDFVWEKSRSIRFIESLLLGLPVPGIFLSKDDHSRLLVVDGQQRLKTLLFFYEEKFPDGREFRLQNIETRFNALTYNELAPEDRRRLDNSIIHATVIQQDKPSLDNSSIYFVFERLNTGAKPLSPQEIRAAIYRGEFNDLIGVLNNNKVWESLIGKLSRKRGEELILRFLALHFDFEMYQKTMKGFLNNFMARNKALNLYSKSKIEHIFENTITIIHDAIGDRAFKPKRNVNAAVMDAVMVGIAKRLENGEIHNTKMLAEKHEQLIRNPEFIDVTSVATSDINTVRERLELATEAFANVD